MNKAMYEVEPIIVYRASKSELGYVDTMDLNRLSHVVYEASKPMNTPKMSIGVLGYRNLDQTMTCVESILRFVGDIDYELILLDNGSNDDNATYNYFQSVPTLRKKVIQVAEPLGAVYGSVFGAQLMYRYATGDIYMFCGNDNIITENALQNMLACLESSPDIGMVTPMSSNAYMLQDPGLKYETREELFAAAKEFNVYDPKKWQERLLIATVATAVKREVLTASGFFDYWSAETGFCLRVRQAGYKTMLLGDTWVCHDHNYETKADTHRWLGKDEDAARMRQDDEERQKKLCGGLTKFGDIMRLNPPFFDMLSQNAQALAEPRLLAVDAHAGQALLDLKNKLRTQGIFNTSSVAFTTDAKYYGWLRTAADEVFCDRMEFINESLAGREFDYIVLETPVNLYKEPIRLLQKLIALLSADGQILFKLSNTSNLNVLLQMLGHANTAGGANPAHITVESIISCLRFMGATQAQVIKSFYHIDENTRQSLNQLLINSNGAKNVQEDAENCLVDNYLFCVQSPNRAAQ